MESKNLKRISFLVIAGLMVFGMTGCKSEEEKMKDAIENSEEKSVGLNDVNVFSDVIGLSEDDKTELNNFMKNMTNDAYDIVSQGKATDEESIKQFSSKYIVNNDATYQGRKLLSTFNNSTEFYDGAFDDKYTKWSGITFANFGFGYIPTSSTGMMFDLNKYGSNDIFSKTKVKYSDDWEEYTSITTFRGYEDMYAGEGLIWLTDLGYYLTQEGDKIKEKEYVPMVSITMVFQYPDKYPETDDKLAESYGNTKAMLTEMNKGSNLNDILLVKTNDGWRVMECKWLYNVENVNNTDFDSLYKESE